jgi:hypothetical protein
MDYYKTTEQYLAASLYNWITIPKNTKVNKTLAHLACLDYPRFPGRQIHEPVNSLYNWFGWFKVLKIVRVDFF